LKPFDPRKNPRRPEKTRRAVAQVLDTREGYEIIRPRDVLRAKAIVEDRHATSPFDMDAVLRAEQALSLLSHDFGRWMDEEVQKLGKARDALRDHGPQDGRYDALYRVAHDIKGQADTLGFPLAARVADSLCILMETFAPIDMPMHLIDPHVDAIRAIVRERAEGLTDGKAVELSDKLTRITSELIHAHRNGGAATRH
jgi:hypothetical protein